VKLGILGGTFDPVHLGHLILAETAREELALDQVIFVPAGEPWRKQGRSITPAEHRLAMVKLAVEDIPEFEVSPLEVEQPGPSYTAETLETIAGENPRTELFLLLGEDTLADIPNWYQPQRIAELAVFAAARRRDRTARRGPTDSLAKTLPGIIERIHWLHMPAIDISASAIRERMRTRRSIRFLVPAAVEEYILRHGLYVEAKVGK